ncbi:MAG: DUF1214 domain-containing protein [Chitinophagales bacterium]
MKIKLLPIFLIILLAFVSGAAIAAYQIAFWDKKAATFINGNWMGNKKINAGDDKLLAARIAVAALFALDPSEAVYLVADTDENGDPLSSAHNYQITGDATNLDARYWSIVLYGSDYFLVPNEADVFSYNKYTTKLEADSSFTINISSDKAEGNWLPSGKEEQFYLALRLYHASPKLIKNIEQVELPVIKKIK